MTTQDLCKLIIESRNYNQLRATIIAITKREAEEVEEIKHWASTEEDFWED